MVTLGSHFIIITIEGISKIILNFIGYEKIQFYYYIFYFSIISSN